MDHTLERRILVADFHALSEILIARGLTAVEVSEEELEKMSLNDLRSLVRNSREVARTPQS